MISNCSFFRALTLRWTGGGRLGGGEEGGEEKGRRGGGREGRGGGEEGGRGGGEEHMALYTEERLAVQPTDHHTGRVAHTLVSPSCTAGHLLLYGAGGAGVELGGNLLSNGVHSCRVGHQLAQVFCQGERCPWIPYTTKTVIRALR